MTQHNTLGKASGAARVDQKGQILFRVDVCASEAIGARSVSDASKVLYFATRVFLVANQDDAVLGQTDLVGGSSRSVNDRPLCHKSLCARILQLKSQFIYTVARVGGRDDGSSPMRSPDADGKVNVVWSKHGNDVPFLPIPESSEAFAKVYGGIACLGVGV
jgi:hypothetical protein